MQRRSAEKSIQFVIVNGNRISPQNCFGSKKSESSYNPFNFCFWQNDWKQHIFSNRRSEKFGVQI